AIHIRRRYIFGRRSFLNSCPVYASYRLLLLYPERLSPDPISELDMYCSVLILLMQIFSLCFAGTLTPDAHVSRRLGQLEKTYALYVNQTVGLTGCRRDN